MNPYIVPADKATVRSHLASAIDPGVAGSSLEDVPIPLMRFRPAADGFEVFSLNQLALDLLATTLEQVAGNGFAEGLYEDDPALLAQALDSVGPEPSKPVLLRWGHRPPATFLSTRFRLCPDGGVLASMCDVTDQ